MTSKSKRNALSAVFVQSVRETGTYSDGGGLNLRVEKSGAKYWFQRVTIDRKAKESGPWWLSNRFAGGSPQSRFDQHQNDQRGSRSAGREARGYRGQEKATDANVLRGIRNRYRNAAADLDERKTRGAVDQHSRNLCVSKNRLKVGHRHHQRGHPGRAYADLDGKTGDGEPGEATHGDGAGLDRSPKATGSTTLPRGQLSRGCRRCLEPSSTIRRCITATYPMPWT